MHWTKAGPGNTENTLNTAAARARELGLKYAIVASCSGDTALALASHGLQVICVSHHVGFAGPGVDEMGPEARALLAAKGIPVLTTTHLLAGVDRAVRNKFGGVYPAEIMAQTLRLFGQGVKVCVEVSVMALDAGLIPFGEDVLAVGGSVEGADSAIIIRPAHSNDFFSTRIREVVCMPRE